LPIQEGSTDFHEVCFDWLCKYGSANIDEGFDGDDNDNYGNDVHDLYYEDDGRDREEVDDDEYTHFGHTFI